MPKKNTRELILKYLPYASFLGFLLVWQLLVDLGVIPRELLATPSEVVSLFIDKLSHSSPDGATLQAHVWISVSEAVIGYLLAVIIGIPLGLLMGWYSVADGLARPVFELIRPIPPVAWIPLAIIWFGVGWWGKIFIIWISGLVPCVINSYAGVRMTNPVFIRMARTYGATDWQIFRQICIPSARQMIFIALEVSLAYSWTTLVAAELVAADVGLGYLIQMGRRLLRPDMIVLGMVVIAVTGVVLGIAVSRLKDYFVAEDRR